MRFARSAFTTFSVSLCLCVSYVVHCLNERFIRWFWPGRQPDRERVLKSVTEHVAPASLYSLTRTVVRA